MSVFLLGMGIVNPLGTAQALSPFGEKAGAASALLGFWQMMGAAIGVYLAATVSHEAMFALGIVLTVASLSAVALYAMRVNSKPSSRRSGFAVVAGDASEAAESFPLAPLAGRGRRRPTAAVLDRRTPARSIG